MAKREPEVDFESLRASFMRTAQRAVNIAEAKLEDVERDRAAYNAEMEDYGDEDAIYETSAEADDRVTQAIALLDCASRAMDTVALLEAATRPEGFQSFAMLKTLKKP
jgi:hypothetical protein